MKGKSSTKGRNGRRKKEPKKQLASIPEVLDVLVHLPSGDKVELRGVSTDLVADLKLLLRQRTDFCHVTNYSFCHPSRGSIPDDLQVNTLRPAELTIVKDDYTPAAALRQAQNLLEITTCTEMMGPRVEMQEPSSCTDGILPGSDAGVVVCQKQQDKGDGDLKISADIKDFYGPFSLSHCKNPFKGFSLQVSDGISFPKFDVEMADGMKVCVESCPNGFHLQGVSKETSQHELVDLLKEASDSFADLWAELMNEIESLFPQGNFPFGIVSNAWVSPPCMSVAPHAPRLLPAEDTSLGAQTLGCAWGQLEGQADRAWANEFEEGGKLLRDASQSEALKLQRKMFLAHSSYTDTAIVEAVSAASTADPEAEQVVLQKAGLEITVSPENSFFVSEAQTPVATRQQLIDEQSQTAILKGMASHDPAVAATAVDPVTVRHLGQRVVAKPAADMGPGVAIDEADEPAAADCGNVYLQLNSLRKLLHTQVPPERGSVDEAAILTNGASVLSSVLEHCTAVVLESHYLAPPLRPELAMSWAQYLKDPPKEGPGAMTPHVQGSRGGRTRHGNSVPLVVSGGSDEGEEALRKELGQGTWKAIAKLGVGIHRLSPEELTRKSREWYQLVALPRVAWELCRLEVVPVDGLTLVDFLHTRGINVRHLGSIVRLNKECAAKEAANAAAMEEEAAAAYAQKSAQQPGVFPQRIPAKIIPGTMSHVMAVCQMEMIARGMKHLLRAVIRAVLQSGGSGLDISGAIAATLNAALGDAESVHHDRVWAWIRTFIARRFKHYLPEDIMEHVNQQALMRACCQKAGLEMCARSYDFACAFPVSPVDVLASIPVVKCQAFSLSHPRQLLDNAKTAMDAGNLGDAATAATEALLYLTNVTGAHNRLTAGAYSLLAVVLYHTGDFLQAAYYQQKALIINERALGLDHPDTLKSYGDLAVFFYRLQHHELALKYVLRCTYMLGLTCGSAHPNTAATYVNIAMMQEGLGNSNAALRYLHAALKCNTALLGSEHVQTAASYHAMAIALSLMDPPLYSLSVQHEQTCWETLERQLGSHDIRTIDAVAWLDYFDQKAAEQAAVKNGTGRAGASWHEKSIASKGHLPVKDLMAFLGETGVSSSKATRGTKRPPVLHNRNEESEDLETGSSGEDESDNSEESGHSTQPVSTDSSDADEDVAGTSPASPPNEGVLKQVPSSPDSVLADPALESMLAEAGIDISLLYDEDYLPRPEAEWMEVKPQRSTRVRPHRNNENKVSHHEARGGNNRNLPNSRGRTAVLVRSEGRKQTQGTANARRAQDASKRAAEDENSPNLSIKADSKWPSLPQKQSPSAGTQVTQAAPEAPLGVKQQVPASSSEPNAGVQKTEAATAKPPQSDAHRTDEPTAQPAGSINPAKPAGQSEMVSSEHAVQDKQMVASPHEVQNDMDAPSLDPQAAAFVPGHGPGGLMPPPPMEPFVPVGTWPVPPPPPPHMWMYPPGVPMPPGFPMPPMPMQHAPMPVTPPPPPPRPMISVAPPPGHKPPPLMSPAHVSPSGSHQAGQQLLQMLQNGHPADENTVMHLAMPKDAPAPVIVTPAAGGMYAAHAAA